MFVHKKGKNMTIKYDDIAAEISRQKLEMFYTPKTKEDFEKFLETAGTDGYPAVIAAMVGFNYAVNALAEYVASQDD